jgi:phosphoribosylglycinamide formyltransferase-1
MRRARRPPVRLPAPRPFRPTARRRVDPARRLGVLISGRGSNLIAILDAIRTRRLNAEVAVVLCNEPGAAGIEAARRRGAEVVVLDHRASATREEHDRRMAAELERSGVALVCLAGYMRLLSPWFIARFRGRILNIHPSLLPAFPGTGAQAAALAHGVRWSGCTVHYVDEDLDAGPIVLQAPVEVRDGDTAGTLAARILAEEHRLYRRAIALHLDGRLTVRGRRVLGAGRAPSTGGRRRR